MKKQNQIHPPQKKCVVSDKLGNDRRRLWVKKSDCTMLLAKGITPNAARALETIIDNFLKRLNLKKEVTFIVTK